MRNKKIILVLGIVLSYILFILCSLYIKNNYEGAFDSSSYEFIIYIPIIFGISYFKSNKRMEKRKNSANITSIIFIILVAVMLIFMLYEPITYVYLTICVIYVLGYVFKTKWFKYLENEKNGSLVMFIFVYIFTSVVYMAFPHICGLKTIEESKSIIEKNGYENVRYTHSNHKDGEKFDDYNFYVDNKQGETLLIKINSKTSEIREIHIDYRMLEE
ncbi:hypothetical protein B5E58_00610 [Tyzzerella sp. An114]|uniref:hypothetical protein n=1 Tax=Tyzzerella sp. An114 TaxID=1965545 RepID=UPI000B44FD92|nr:hypothetical protein [Tyzzerella sp. An114]OUQ60403.1 hypothetical protein B5E58_00610 [Tyzzerella sp. An114]